MVNEPIVAPIEPTIPTPVVETPVVAPIEPVQAVIETPVVVNTDPTKIVPETAPEAPAAVLEPVKAPETLLGADKLEPAKVEELLKAVEPEATITEGGQSEETAPPPTYDPFTLPEGIQLETEKITEFNGLLAELEKSGKADHSAVQAFGQKAVDFYLNETKKVLEDQQKLMITTWERQKNDWKESFLKDPEIGGNRFQTSVDSANSFIRTHGGTVEQQTEFRNLMETSGLGNHPSMIRILAKAGSAMSEGRPLTANLPPSAPKSKVTTLYGKTS